MLIDMASATNLNVCNEGNKPTFVRGPTGTHIDVTFASEGIIPKVNNWRVIDEESLSLHKYILFEIKSKQKRSALQICTGWQIKKFNMEKLKQAMNCEMNEAQQIQQMTATDGAESYHNMLLRVADKCMPRRNGEYKRPPAYWWSDEISNLRKTCFKSKRAYQRKRRKRNEQDCENEARQYKASRKSLALAIKKAKEKC